MADMTWTIPDSSHHYSDCGADIGTWENMLDEVDYVAHTTDHTHTLVLDFGSSLDISRVGLKGVTALGSYAPDDVDLYISDTVGTWGTAVATGIDPSTYTVDWLDTTITRTTGRYMKIEIVSTQNAANVLVWGGPSKAVIRYWEGDIPKKYTTIVNLKGKYDSNASTSYTPTNGQRGLIPFDGSKYNNIVAAYGVGTGKRTGSSGADPIPRWSYQLYDDTNTQHVVGASGGETAYETIVGTESSANLPAGVATLSTRYKMTDSTSSQHMNFEMHIVQESETTGNKTCVYVPMASYSSSFSTAYNQLSTYPASNPTGHQWKYVAADWDCTIDKVYFYATIRSGSTARTVSCKLDDIAQGGALETFTTTSLSYILKEGSDIKGDLVDGTTYALFMKSTLANQGTDVVVNAGLVFEISDMDGFPTYQDIGILGKYTTSTGWLEDATQQVKYLNTEPTYFSSDVTRAIKHQGVIEKGFGANAAETSIYDDGVRNSTADLTGGGTGTPDWFESSALTIADESLLTIGYNLTTLKFGNITAASCVLIKYLSDLGLAGAGTNMEVNIGDAWKTVDSMQINIGDTWKDVESVQINIGDTWKDVY